MAVHAKYTLGGARIAQVFNLSFAVTASETLCTEGLVTSENGEILDFVSARVTAISTVTADQ